MSSSLGFSSLYDSTVQPGPFGFPSTNAALPPYSRLQTSHRPFYSLRISLLTPYPLSHASGCFPIPPVFSSRPDSLRVFLWNSGDLQDRSTEVLHFVSFHTVDLICTQESNLNSFSSFGILVALLCDLIALTTGLGFFFSMTHPQAAGSSFLSDRVYPSLNFLPTLFPRLIPTLTMYRSTSHYTILPRSFSLLFMLLLLALFRQIARPIPFSPSFFFPLKISSFCETSTAMNPLGLQRYF